MRYIVILTLILASFVSARSTITIKLCKEKNYDCQYLPLQDVRSINRINEGNILQITFFNGELLHININNQYYEILR